VAATIEWPGHEAPTLDRKERFDVVYHLYSFPKKHRVRLKVRVPEEDPAVDSVTPVWKAANWFEREAYDMFGITFKGHPDLRRILCHQEFKGHALRKDYDPGRRHLLKQTYDAFSPEDIERFEKEGIKVAPDEGKA
jgi:NADH/F420H2 dehydrogenase subunit C